MNFFAEMAADPSLNSERLHLGGRGADHRLLDLVLPRLGRPLPRPELQLRRPGRADPLGRAAGARPCRAAAGAAQPDQPALPVQQPEFGVGADPRRRGGEGGFDGVEAVALPAHGPVDRPERDHPARQRDRAAARLSRDRAVALSRPRGRGRASGRAGECAGAVADPAADRRECGQIWRCRLAAAEPDRDQGEPGRRRGARAGSRSR